jgi:hypothetical protein
MMVGIMSPNEELPPTPQFLTIEDVGLELATSRSQVYALLRSGDLKGIQIGGRASGGSSGSSWRSTSRRRTGALVRPSPTYPPI